MHTLTLDDVERQTERRLAALRRELENAVAPQRVTAVGRSHFERLVDGATIWDFIPLLVYRCTRDELSHGDRTALDRAA